MISEKKNIIITLLILHFNNYVCGNPADENELPSGKESALKKTPKNSIPKGTKRRLVVQTSDQHLSGAHPKNILHGVLVIPDKENPKVTKQKFDQKYDRLMSSGFFKKADNIKNLGESEPSVYYISEVAEYSTESNPYYSEKKELRVERSKNTDENTNRKDKNTSNAIELKKREIKSDLNLVATPEKRDKIHRIKLKVKDVKENAKREKMKTINVESETAGNVLKKSFEFLPMVDREALTKRTNSNGIIKPISSAKNLDYKMKSETKMLTNGTTNSARSNGESSNEHLTSKHRRTLPSINVQPTSAFNTLSKKYAPNYSKDASSRTKQKLNDINTQISGISDPSEPLKNTNTGGRKLTSTRQLNTVSRPNHIPPTTSGNHLSNREKKNSIRENTIRSNIALLEAKKPREEKSNVITSVNSRSHSFNTRTPSPSFNMWLAPKKVKLSKRFHKHSKNKRKSAKDAETPEFSLTNSNNSESRKLVSTNSAGIAPSLKKEKKRVKDNTNERVNTDVKSDDIFHFDVPTLNDIPEETNSESLNTSIKKIHKSSKKRNTINRNSENGENKKSSGDIEISTQSSVENLNIEKHRKLRKKSKRSLNLTDRMRKKKTSDVSENKTSKRKKSSRIHKILDGKSGSKNTLEFQKEGTTKLNEDRKTNLRVRSDEVKINSKISDDKYRTNECPENRDDKCKNSVSREKDDKLLKIQGSNNAAKKAESSKKNNGKIRNVSKLTSNSKIKSEVEKNNSAARLNNERNISRARIVPKIRNSLREIPVEQPTSIIPQHENIEGDFLEGVSSKGKIVRKKMTSKKPKSSGENYREKRSKKIEENNSLSVVTGIPDEIKETANVKKIKNSKSIPNNEPTGVNPVNLDTTKTKLEIKSLVGEKTENQISNGSKYSTTKNQKIAENKNNILRENKLLPNINPVEKETIDNKSSHAVKLSRSSKNKSSDVNDKKDSISRENAAKREKINQKVESHPISKKDNLENNEIANKSGKILSAISQPVKERHVKSLENNSKLSGKENRFEEIKNSDLASLGKMSKSKTANKEDQIKNNETLNRKPSDSTTRKPTKPIVPFNSKPTNAADSQNQTPTKPIESFNSKATHAADFQNQTPTKPIESFNSKPTHAADSRNRKLTKPTDSINPKRLISSTRKQTEPLIPKPTKTVDLPNARSATASLVANKDEKINSEVQEVSTKVVLQKMKEVNYPEIPSATWKSGKAIECGKQNPVSKRSELIARPMMYTGEETRYGEAPWFAVIISKETKQPICGATVITPYLVISAAHCFKDYEENEDGSLVSTYDVTIDQFYIGLGKLSRELIKDHRHSRLLRAAALYVKDEFRGKVDEYKNDIALIETDGKAIQYSRAVLPACLKWSHRESIYPPNETEAWLTGIGRTGKKDEEQLSSYVKTAKLRIYPLEKCEARLNFTIKLVGTSNICAGHIENADGPQMRLGDSGGGLTVVEGGQHYLYGIASLREGKTNLGFYTNVMDHIRWITKINEITNNKRASR